MTQTLKTFRSKSGVIVLMTGLIISLLFSQSLDAQKNISYSPFNIVKTGTGRPMILIPGLFCSGEVWEETTEHFKNSFTCYTVTLPGFAGQPAMLSDSMLKTFAMGLDNFIQENHLQKPIIVGHSLGGVVALQMALLHPGLIGDLVIVSSAPFLPALSMSPDVSIDSTKKIGLLIKNSMKNLTPAQILSYQKFTLGTMIRDTAKIALVSVMASKSDPNTQGEVMLELFSMDLRPEMKNIQCPILVLGDWIAYKNYGATRESVQTNYTGQFSLAKNVRITINDSSRHFIMYDEPAWFYQQIENFLGR